MSTIPITKRGAELLKEELHRLKHVERPAVIISISEARAQGDLSENAEYDAAKEKQGFIEGRIQELEGMPVMLSPSADVFRKLHGVSSVLFLIQSALGIYLVWRLTKPNP